MAPKGYWQIKCARPGCGHPRGKHTHKPNPGCTVDLYSRRRTSSGRLVSVRRDCECTGFRESEG